MARSRASANRSLPSRKMPQSSSALSVRKKVAMEDFGRLFCLRFAGCVVHGGWIEDVARGPGGNLDKGYRKRGLGLGFVQLPGALEERGPPFLDPEPLVKVVVKEHFFFQLGYLLVSLQEELVQCLHPFENLGGEGACPSARVTLLVVSTVDPGVAAFPLHPAQQVLQGEAQLEDCGNASALWHGLQSMECRRWPLESSHPRFPCLFGFRILQGRVPGFSAGRAWVPRLLVGHVPGFLADSRIAGPCADRVLDFSGGRVGWLAVCMVLLMLTFLVAALGRLSGFGKRSQAVMASCMCLGRLTKEEGLHVGAGSK